MGKYAQLQAAWKVLGDAHQETAWIKGNRKKFEKLGVKISDAKDAENAFVGDTSTVVESFKARSKAAARLAQLTEEYHIQMDLADEIACGNALEVSRQYRKQIEAGISADTKRF